MGGEWRADGEGAYMGGDGNMPVMEVTQHPQGIDRETAGGGSELVRLLHSLQFETQLPDSQHCK
jgi:hypothetical protein